MPKTILLADDSITIQKVVELTFMDEDYRVEAVSDGDTALARLNEVGPDLVISDVHMPGANGYEVCRQVKEQMPNVPVVLLVGTFEPYDPSQAEAAGADGNLKKPFDSQDLLRMVGELTGDSAEPSEAPVDAPEPAAAQPVAAEAAATPPPAVEPAADPAVGTTVFAMPSPTADAEAAQVATSEAPSIEADSGQGIAADMASEAAAQPSEAEHEVAGEPADDAAAEAEFAISDLPPWRATADTRPTERRTAPEPSPVEPEAASPAAETASEVLTEAPTSADPVPEAAVPVNESSPLEDTGPMARVDSAEIVTEDQKADGDGDGAEVSETAPTFGDDGVGHPASFAEPEGAGSEIPAAEEPSAAPTPAAAVEEQTAASPEPVAAPAAEMSLSDEDVDRIARRVVELAGEQAVRDVAWEVLPDLAEVVIRERLRELEGQIE